ncbi:MAG: ATP-grasp domain-containing protein [bacterium]
MKIAVVRNRKNEGIINNFGRKSPETYGKKSVQRVVEALHTGGHEVKIMEGDMTLFSHLKEFIPPDRYGLPTGLVFNMSYGIQGDCRYTHVPGMLEMSGIPYIGANPLGHSLAQDKVITKMLLQSAGIPTPKMCVMAAQDKKVAQGLRFPLVVKPRHESTSCGLHLVHDHDQLLTAVLSVTTQFQQEALVEEFIQGREFCVGVLGNDELEILTYVELDFNDRKNPLLTREDKFHKTANEPKKICPAQISYELESRIKHIVEQTFRVCHCKDFARVDLRVDPFGNPYVLEINSMASLGQGGSFVLAAKGAGYGLASLINRIVDIACRRYGLFANRNIVPIPHTDNTPAYQNIHDMAA